MIPLVLRCKLRRWRYEQSIPIFFPDHNSLLQIVTNEAYLKYGFRVVNPDFADFVQSVFRTGEPSIPQILHLITNFPATSFDVAEGRLALLARQRNDFRGQSFGYFDCRVWYNHFPGNIIELQTHPFIPVSQGSTFRMIAPRDCLVKPYEERSYLRKVFHFVHFDDDVIVKFLLDQLRVRREPTVAELIQKLLEDPTRFREKIGDDK